MSTFRQQLREFAKKVETATLETAKGTTTWTRDRVAERTPILTGQASASWNASVNEPDTEVKPTSYLNPQGAPKDGKVNLEGVKLGDIFYVSNSKHYIGDLNAGSSRKAPAGFVEGTMADLPIVFSGIVNEARKKAGLK